MASAGSTEQRVLSRYVNANNNAALTSFPPKPLTTKAAVYFLMDWEAEFRDRGEAFSRANLWRMTHRVSAMLGRPINPETVARRRRDYWNKVV